MRKGLTSFGLMCRHLRAGRGLVMGKQAKALGCSVSYISAIERGSRDIPTDFPDKVSQWMALSDSQANELRHLAARRRKTIQFTPVDEERSLAATEFANTLNHISVEQIREIRRVLSSKPSRQKLSGGEIKKLAAIARACFELSNRLTFDLIDVLENRISEIEPQFFLEVEANYKLGDQIAAYANTTIEKIQKIVLSEHAYSSAAEQMPEGREIAAHEFAHWLMHSGEKLTFQRYKRWPLQCEDEADQFAREFLMPELVARRFDSPNALAFACNVPRSIATKRMLELGLWPAIEKKEIEREQVSSGFTELLAILKENSSDDGPKVKAVAPTPDFQLIQFPRSPIRVTPDKKLPTPRKLRRVDSLPLFDFAERNALFENGSCEKDLTTTESKSEVLNAKKVSSTFEATTVNRSLAWYKIFGWR